MSDTLVITDNTNHTWRGRAVDAQLIVINASTGLIWLPDDLVTQAAPLVDSRDLQSLTVNEWLTVNYWDDTAGHVAQRDFQIVQIKDGVAKLADPDRLINLGDSGGSVYLDGKLIGNIWSIELDGAYQAMGSFNVALLPSQVRSYVP